MDGLEKYRSVVSQTMLQTYYDIIEKLNVTYNHFEVLDMITSSYPKKFDKMNIIDDPIVLFLLILRDTNCSYSDAITLFYSKFQYNTKQSKPKLIRKTSEENISNIMDKYLHLTPKKILKNISDEDISDISRRSSIDSLNSPVANY